MIRKNISRYILLALLVITSACGSSDDQQKKSEEKQQEPVTEAEYVQQATFTDFDGNKVSMSDYEGKVVLIDFWETWCKPCLASFPTMQKLQEEYPDDFQVLAVTPGFMDTRKDAKTFADEHDYTFDYLMDSNNLHRKLGVQGIPFKVFVDADGQFIEKSLGSSGPDVDYKKIKGIIEEHKDSKNSGNGI